MEKRILLSFALSIGVLLIFYQFFYTPPTLPTAPPEPAVVEAEERPVGTAPEVPEIGVGEVPEPSGRELQARRIEADTAEAVTIETEVFSLVVSNEGAVLHSIRLLDYAGARDETLELLDPVSAATAGWPLALVTGDAAVDDALENGLWVMETSNSVVRLELARDGFEAFKEIRIDDSGYFFTLEAGVEQVGRALPFAVAWQGSFGDQSIEYASDQANVVFMEDGAFDRINAESIEDPQPVPVTQFLGVEDHYFIAMMRGPAPVLPLVRSVPYQVPGEEEMHLLPRIELPYGGELGVYVGPKQQTHLNEMDPAMASVIDYGWFEFIAKPLLSVLLWIHGYVGNFGWSIILMTILINVALFPLRLKQQLSMAKMQKIQPQMRTLQDKYKKLKPNDPRRQEVQSEMMGLYQKNGVNPLGGCFPMLLQMPIFFAIFQLLRSAFELRQAPWVLWIDDLSVYDPYYVLPVLMGVSMLATQRLTPTAMDPAQARMMMMMPVVFLVFMIRVQSGLVLYWLTSNLVGVGQQLVINKFWVPKPKKDSRAEVIEVAAEDVKEIPASGFEAEPDARRRRRRKR